jgi:hypothetical protein
MITQPRLERAALRGSLAALALVFAAAPAAGQAFGPEQAIQLTDVTGPAITTGDQVAGFFADPGPIRTMECPVAWGVRTAADAVFFQLDGGELRPVVGVGAEEMPVVTDRNVLRLLTADPRDRAAADAVVAGLARGNNRQAERAARRLVGEAHGLFNTLRRIDPLRPGVVAPTRLSRSVGAFNAFIDASDPAFLAQPSEEFIALHTVFNSLVIASIEHAGRPAEPDVVDARGLACAMLVERPEPPAEQAIEFCVLLDRDFRDVIGLVRPGVGDTMVIVDGVRRPFAEAYPEADRMPVPDWLVNQEPVTIGGVRYTQFGRARPVRPGELTFAGQAAGAEFFVPHGERAPVPPVIYFPIAPNCVVQPYQPVEAIRVRG